jgi:CRISP-associated protein Cas1
MLGRIVEIAEDDRYLSVQRGFLVVSERQQEIARVAFDDIGALVGNAHGLSYSNNVLVNLAERGIPFVICAQNHRPVSVVWPIDGHHEQAGRIRAQSSARRPVKKRLWQLLVQHKIREQAAVLEALNKPHKAVLRLAARVKSGDPSNAEAQAARLYWRTLFGKTFRRDPDEDGINALLNYGYAILRAACARAVVAAGLHPSLGLFHRSAGNAFQLVDDVMEPYRPFVDATVFALVAENTRAVSKFAKRMLALSIFVDRQTDEGATPMSRCIGRTVASIASAYTANDPAIWFPNVLSAADVRQLLIEAEGNDASKAIGVPADVANSDV